MEILLLEKQGTERYYEFFKDDTKIGVAYIGFDYDHIYLPKGYETYSNGTYVYGVTIFEQFRNKGY